MKRTFLLDENMVMRGLLGRSSAARDVWLMIARNCHRIAVSPLLANKYWGWLRQKRTRAAPEVATGMTAIVSQILANSEKSVWVEPEAPSPLARLIRDVDDRFLADIAGEVVKPGNPGGCILVTVDRQTREDFNHPEMRELGIEGVTIERGLALASTTNG